MSIENPCFQAMADFWNMIYSGNKQAAPFDFFHCGPDILEKRSRVDASTAEALLRPWLRPKARVLDFGCGIGRLTKRLAEAHPQTEFVATDISTLATKQAAKSTKGLHNTRILPFDGRTTAQLEQDSVAVVLAWHVVERVPRHLLNLIIREWNRVLRIGGAACIDVPFLSTPYKSGRTLDEPMATDYFTPRRFDRKTLDLVFGALGFELRSITQESRTYTISETPEEQSESYTVPRLRVVAAKTHSLPAPADDFVRLGLCNLCGHHEFEPGPNGRASKSLTWPRCAGCRSLERSRILRRILDRIPAEFLSKRKALQFSNEFAYRANLFASHEISVYGGENSMDLQRVPRPDGSYNWIICNHVLEHVEDDGAAMRELGRICADDGVLQLAVPAPLSVRTTREFGFADPKQHFHWRAYGRDFPKIFIDRVPGFACISVEDVDHITNVRDIVYFFARKRNVLEELGFVQSKARSMVFYD